MSRWFRYYADALDDPKVQRLDGNLFKTWVNLLCLASRNDGKLPPMEDIAFALRCTEDVALSRIADLISKGLIDDVDGVLGPHNWENRQFRSDKDETAAERKRRQREREQAERDAANNVTRDSTEMSPVQIRTEQSIEEKVLSETSSDKPKPKKTRGEYSEGFLAFWKAFPTDSGMSKLEAAKAWEKLSEEDRGHAVAAIPGFVAWVARQGKDYRTVHACRYLSQRRFEGFAEAKQQAGGACLSVPIIREGTPEWDELKKSRPRLVARDIQTPNGIVRGEYGRAA